MKFSYQWLRELVPGLDVPARELQDLITVRTAECEGIETAGDLLAGARVVRVVEANGIEGTHLTKATVNLGDSESVTVVCGAPNCRAGMTAIWVPVGSRAIRGIESDGMLASAAELGLGREDAAILEWSAGPLPQPDWIIEIDNKSLTHRPDLWGHLGMAREVAAITRRDLHDPVESNLLPGGSDSYDLRIEDYDLCPRFSVVVFENVRIAPSPSWLQYRLLSVGINPINNVVDVTNFVMAELAQPMHAFDRERIHGDRLIVRAASPGETLEALNGESYSLTASDGVVADGKRALSIAGIIGGTESGISDDTRSVVLESANWNASRIRRTSARLKLRTDASMRFEKAQDPANTVRALARAIALMKVVCPEARLEGRLTDDYRSLPKPQIIGLNLDMVDRKLGRPVRESEVSEILERLQFGVRHAAPRELEVTVPTWRATKDVKEPDDLVEEIGRMVGYETIPAVAPLVACVPPPDNPQRSWRRRLRALAADRGFTEVYNYSFLSDEQASRFELNPEDAVRVLNPISSEQNVLRPSLIPGIFASIELNRKHQSSFRIFEIGREIHNQRPATPLERVHFVAALYAAEGDGRSGLFEMKGFAEALAPWAHYRPTTDVLGYEHPARTADIVLDTTVIGRLFEAHPAFIQGRAAVLDLNLDKLFELRPPEPTFVPIPRFPSSSFDLSVLVPERELSANTELSLREFAGPLLRKIEFLREYVGPQLPAGMKSISYRLTLESPERTLSSSEIQDIRNQVIQQMHAGGFETRT